MSIHPILLIGGSGVVSRQTAQLLRAAHPNVPILIGGATSPKPSPLTLAVRRA